MPETTTGYILDVADNGDLKLSLPPELNAEVGERFAVLDGQGKYVAEIKVVHADQSETIARFFQPFVTNDALRAASSGASAATAGAVLGSVVAPVIGTVLGGAMAILVANALRRQRPRQRIERGMAIIPITGSDKGVTLNA